MGFLLSLWVCQMLRVHIAHSISSVGIHGEMFDKKLAPSLDPFIHAEDKFVMLLVIQLRPFVQSFRMQVYLDGTFKRAHLSYFFRRGAWRLRLGVEHISRRGWASGEEIEINFGYVAFRALIRRELLASLRAVCAFVVTHCRHRVPLAICKEQELQRASIFIFFATRDLSAVWSESVRVIDASWWGCGVVKKHVDVATIKQIGKYNGRWRFSADSESHLAPRGEDVNWASYDDGRYSAPLV
jgi:hypothetical protein